MQCRARVFVSYPALDTQSFLQLDETRAQDFLWSRGLHANGYVLFLSRITLAKGVDDLIAAYRKSAAYQQVPLVIAGDGPERTMVEAIAAEEPCVRYYRDVDDDEKKALMRGASAFVLPSKPRPEFVETFGIALVEKMLVGGLGPIITTRTGGIPEAVGEYAVEVEAGNVVSIQKALERALFGMSDEEKRRQSAGALRHAMRFDRKAVFDDLMGSLAARSRLSATGS